MRVLGQEKILFVARAELKKSQARVAVIRPVCHHLTVNHLTVMSGYVLSVTTLRPIYEAIRTGCQDQKPTRSLKQKVIVADQFLTPTL